MTEKPGLIIIEDHPVMREGLAAYFEGTGRWQVVGIAAELDEAKEILSHTTVNVVLLDIQLENGWGLDIIPWLKQPEMPIIAVYSVFDDYAHVRAALGMGVRAYICKRRNQKELEQALLKALQGQIYIDDSVQAKLNTAADLFSLLTKRESEILSLVKDGLSNKEIAARLRISYRTVENILSCVYDKTGIKSRLELARQ